MTVLLAMIAGTFKNGESAIHLYCSQWTCRNEEKTVCPCCCARVTPSRHCGRQLWYHDHGPLLQLEPHAHHIHILLLQFTNSEPLECLHSFVEFAEPEEVDQQTMRLIQEAPLSRHT